MLDIARVQAHKWELNMIEGIIFIILMFILWVVGNIISKMIQNELNKEL